MMNVSPFARSAEVWGLLRYDQLFDAEIRSLPPLLNSR